MWSVIEPHELGRWFTLSLYLTIAIVVIGPLVLIAVYYINNRFDLHVVRLFPFGICWALVITILMHLDQFWVPGTISFFEEPDFRMIEHPIFAIAFYLCYFCSAVLWITFPRKKRWLLQAIIEFLPLLILTVIYIVQSSAEKPPFPWDEYARLGVITIPFLG